MNRKKIRDFILHDMHFLSDHDKLRLLQCVYCMNDPYDCGCTEKNEYKNGMCKKYIPQKEDV